MTEQASPNAQPRKSRKVLYWMLAIVTLLIIGAVMRKDEPPIGTARTADSGATVDGSAVDTGGTSAAPPSSESASTPTTTSNTIPGLVAVDVHGNFSDKGFECDGMKIIGDDNLWNCEEKDQSHSYQVEVFGTSPTQIKSVRYTSLDFSGSPDEVARQFLAYGASLQYDGADPAAAKAWVEGNVGKNAETEIGGVKFELTAAGTARMLRISP